MIRFNNTSSIEDVEAGADELLLHKVNDLQIPTQLASRSLGFQASLIQFICTWARVCERPDLITHIQAEEEPGAQLDNLSVTAHGLIALLAAKSVRRANGDDISENASETGARRYKELNKIETKRDRLLLLVADNHAYTPKAASFVGLAPKDKSKRASRKDGFISDLRFYLARCLRVSAASTLASSDFDHLLETAYEVFANTEEWGSSDLSSSPLTNSIRGLLTEIIPIEAIESRLGGSRYHINPPFRRYLEFLSTDRETAATQLLELSIFDSGVGLAQRELNRSLDSTTTPLEEYRAVVRCLRRHGTSSQDDTRGNGLFEVMRLLTRLRGFFRLRTGRLALFRNFIEDRFFFEDDGRGGARDRVGIEYLWDWGVDPRIERTLPDPDMTHIQRALVAGTLVTIWIPLRTSQLNLFDLE
jgi:hypothetical protein